MTDTLPIYDQLAAERYDPPNTSQRHPTPHGGTPVDLAQIEQDVRQHFEGLVARAHQDVTAGEEWLASKLPALADLVHQAQGNELVQAGLAAVHVPASVLSGFAAAVNALEAELAKATGQPEPANAEAEQPPTGPPAEPSPFQAFVPQAGPVVGGQA